jgi:Na+(H+)/acetate symporter ActP
MIAALIAAVAILGGMRSLTWTGSARFLVGAVGLAIVVTPCRSPHQRARAQ